MFSENLRRLRREKGYTQKDLAEKLGITSSTIGMYEQGRRCPGNDTLCRIAKLLGVQKKVLLQDLHGDGDEDEDEKIEDLIMDIKNNLLLKI